MYAYGHIAFFHSWIFLLLILHAPYDNMGRIFVMLVKIVFWVVWPYPKGNVYELHFSST